MRVHHFYVGILDVATLPVIPTFNQMYITVCVYVYVYLCGHVSHITDHSSLAGDNAGHFFGEGGVLKLWQVSPTMKRKALSH